VSQFTIGIIQDHAGADLQENVRRAEKLVRQAAAKGAQIICLKELFSSPYFCKAQKSDRFDLAETVPGPSTDAMQKLARELEVVIVVPVFERQAAGVYRNSAAIIDADGSLMGVYRKMHIPDDPLFYEKYYFTPGEHDERIGSAGGFKVWKTRYATIGVLICWDQWYPEAARITSLLGAQVLFYPTAIGWHPAEKKEWGPGAGRCLEDDAARACDRQRRLCRVTESHRTRGRAGHRRDHLLRSFVHRRSVWSLPRRGG
jgi:N-carbamoylputrescine amidase